MDWQDFIASAVSGLAGSGILAAIGIPIVRGAIRTKFQKDVDRYRSELKGARQAELEELRSGLTADRDASLERMRAELRRDHDVELERLKAQLRHEHELELEKTRADLRSVGAIREIAYAKLQERRVSVACELYRRLARLHRAAIRYTSLVELAGEPDVADKERDFADQFHRTRDYFDENAPVLPENTVELVGQFVGAMLDAARDRQISQSTNDHKMWIDAWKQVKGMAEDARKTIRGDIRALLRGEGDT